MSRTLRLLIVRHAIAQERTGLAGGGGADAARPLTAEGAARMRRGAAGLRRLVPDVEEIATSPLVRARQTAEILAAAYEGLEVVVAEPLAPGHAPQDVLAWIDQRRPARTLAAVGHEPGLSCLASWLLSGEAGSFLELKKGAACLLELSRLAPAAGTLLWLAPPRTLRRIGE